MAELREKINKNAGIVGVIAGVAVLIAIGVAVWQMSGGYEPPPAAEEVYYTDDDGKTFFKDSALKISPFNHDGKDAYRAGVYESKSGDKFVGVIYRHNAAGKKAMEAYIANPPEDPEGATRMGLEYTGMDVKSVKSGTWAPVMDHSGEKIITRVKGPDGEPATPVEE